MARLSIADLLARRASRAPQDAAALAQALARELNRARSSADPAASSDDAAAAAAALWRAASDLRRQRAEGVRIGSSRSDRRRQHPPATELRRSIRRLEQQLFAARQESARRVEQRRRRVIVAGCVALGCTLALFGTAMWRTEYRQTPPAEVVANDTIELERGITPQPVGRIEPIATAPKRARSEHLPDVATTPLLPTRATPAAPAAEHPRRTVRVRREHGSRRVRSTTTRKHTTPTHPAPSFAGGTRSITWAAGR
jgi:hypothetical protein